MNGQQETPQGPGDGVPLLDDTDPKNPRVTLVPNDKVDEAIRLGAKRVSTANYQNSLNQARKAKPSAAAPTPTVPAATPPSAGRPVPGAPGVTTTSPGGTTKVPGQTLGAGATGTMPGITPDQFSNVGQMLKGAGKEVGRQAMRLGGAFGVVSPSMARNPSLAPQTQGPESIGSQGVQFAENFLPLGATEKIGVEATDVLANNAPRIAKWAEIPLGFVTRTLYNIGTEGATAALQGRDPKQAAETAAWFGAVTEPMAMASPVVLRQLFGVKEEMGKNVGRAMLEMKGFGPYTREEFNKRAEGLYNAAAREVNKVAGLATSRNYPKSSVPAGAILSDLDDTISKSFGPNRAKLKGMRADIERTIGGVSGGNLKAAIDEEEKIKKTIAELTAKIPQQRPMVQRASQQALAFEQDKLKEAQKILRNVPVTMTPAQINRLRRGLGDNYVNWGKSNAELKESEKYAKKLYGQISDQLGKSLSAVRPDIARVIRDENAMRDIWKGTAREQSVGIGIHSLGKTGALPKVMATFGGWELGHRFGGLPGGIAGAIAGSRAANPLVSAAARAAHSGAVRGLPLALEETFRSDNYPDQDWSKKGKTTPYGPME